MLGRAQGPRANGAWLSKLTEWNMKCFILGQTIDQKARRDGRERLGEMRKGRRERIEKGSREGIEKETKRQFEEKEGLRDPPPPPLLEFLDPTPAM